MMYIFCGCYQMLLLVLNLKHGMKAINGVYLGHNKGGDGKLVGETPIVDPEILLQGYSAEF